MAIRFRRSVRIFPGLRMNFSGSGIGLSMGVPGARVTVGPTGIYRHLSVPGTGLYSRKRVRIDGGAGGGRGGSGPSVHAISVLNYQISQEDPTMRLLDEHTDEPLPPATVRWVRKHYGDTLAKELEESARAFNAPLEAIETIHIETPAPSPAAQFVIRPFTEVRPEPPVEEPMRGLGRFFPGAKQRHQEAHEAALAAWREEHEAWEVRSRAHQDEQTPLRNAFAARNHDEEAASIVLAYRLDRVQWPRETVLDWDLQGDRLFLDVDLPLQDTVPTRRYRTLQRGLRLGVTELSDTAVRRTYMRYVHGALFRAVGEAFHALPEIQTVVVSGFTQEADPGTGEERDTFLVSAMVQRTDWGSIRFDALDQVDPVVAFERYPHRRNMTQTGIFREIKPFSANDLPDT